MTFLRLAIGMLTDILTNTFWQKNYTRLIKQREEITGKIGA